MPTSDFDPLVYHVIGMLRHHSLASQAEILTKSVDTGCLSPSHLDVMNGLADLTSGLYKVKPLQFVAKKEAPYVAPDFFCPQCNKQAAPEHVSIFCEQRTGSYGEIEVVNGHKCKCWWCQTEWEEA